MTLPCFTVIFKATKFCHFYLDGLAVRDAPRGATDERAGHFEVVQSAGRRRWIPRRRQGDPPGTKTIKLLLL